MWRFRLILCLLMLSYFSFMCTGKGGDEHAQEDHVHTEGSDHVHGDEDDEHEPGEEHSDEESHNHASEEQEHLHADDQSHTHEADDHTHDPAETVPEQDHEHDSEGLISVEGDWEALVGLQTVRASVRSIERLVAVPGKIIANQNQVAKISPFVESSVNCVFKNLGDMVEEGDLLACLTSPQIGMLRAEYDKAKAELEISNQDFTRKKRLHEEKIISDKAYQEAELGLKVAEVNYNYTLKRLLAMGLKQEEIDDPPTEHSDAVGSTIHVYAPMTGVITKRNASLGQKVNLSSELFEIIDIDNVWLEADIFEKDLHRIELGQMVKARVAAYEEDLFTGNIFYIGSTLNQVTKTIKVLVEIDNASRKLKPGMFANTHIVVGRKPRTLVIPRIAVLEDEHLQIVFVKEDAGYHRHIVTVGIVADDVVEIVSGLSDGNQVVTQGNYQLKSKLKMSGIDPHAGHVH